MLFLWILLTRPQRLLKERWWKTDHGGTCAWVPQEPCTAPTAPSPDWPGPGSPTAPHIPPLVVPASASCWEGSLCPVSACHPPSVPAQRDEGRWKHHSVLKQQDVSLLCTSAASNYASGYLPSLPQCTLLPATALPSDGFALRPCHSLSQCNLVFWSKVALQIRNPNVFDLHLWQEFLWILNLPLDSGLEAPLEY